MMTRIGWLWLATMLMVFGPGRAEAQVRYPGAPYGYQITNGRIGPGYGLNTRAYAAARSGGTVTDYQSLINAITSLPGWNGPAAPSRPVRPHPTLARNQLLG